MKFLEGVGLGTESSGSEFEKILSIDPDTKKTIPVNKILYILTLYGVCTVLENMILSEIPLSDNQLRHRLHSLSAF